MNKKKCLKADGDCSVYLAEEDGIPVIVKETSQSEHALLIENEYRLLERIHGTGEPWAASFPRPIRLTQGKTTSLVRSYIPGVSLETLTEARKDRPGLPMDKAAEIILSVLEILKRLHGMRPPIIQRDIKPQNIIINDDGCHIIDMGISRTLIKEQPRDTVIIGTPLTAPPEQFGFCGTDERSDLYSVGVLFGYLLTGEYDLRQPGLPPRARRIIRRAAAFDPDRRYRNAGQMAAAVRRLLVPRRAAVRRALLALLFSAAVILPILFLTAPKGTRRFREPLIEQAVRYQVGRPDGPLTGEDLLSVTSLSIFGKQAGIREEDIWFLGDDPYIRDGALREAGLWKENGGISSLADLKALPNLREVRLYNQNISDISVLKELRLVSVGLGYNPISDLSALKDCTGIEKLNLTCLPADPSGVLASLTGLKELSVSGVPMDSLEVLESLHLEALNLFGTGPEGVLGREAWQSLERMPSLKKLTINKLDQGILDALAASGISDLEVTHSNGVSFAEMQRLPRLKRLYFYSDEGERVGASPLAFPEIEWLDIKNVTLESLSCLSGMTKLSTLHIYAASCLDYGGLEGLGSLRIIYCAEDQREALREKYPGAPWSLR